MIFVFQVSDLAHVGKPDHRRIHSDWYALTAPLRRMTYHFGRVAIILQRALFAVLLLAELVLAHHAQGALEVGGDVLPFGTRSDAALGVALGFVVFPAANVADIFHKLFLLGF